MYQYQASVHYCHHRGDVNTYLRFSRSSLRFSSSFFLFSCSSARLFFSSCLSLALSSFSTCRFSFLLCCASGSNASPTNHRHQPPQSHGTYWSAAFESTLKNGGCSTIRRIDTAIIIITHLRHSHPQYPTHGGVCGSPHPSGQPWRVCPGSCIIPHT